MVCKGGPSTAHLQGQQFPSGCTKLGSPRDRAGMSSAGPRVLTPPHARRWMEMASQSQAVLSPLHGLGAKRKEIPRVPGSKGHVVNQGSPGHWVLWMLRGVAVPWEMRTPGCHPAMECRLSGKGEVAWPGAGRWPRGEMGSVPGWQLSGRCVQLTGRWYSIGLASNSNWFKEKKHLMKMCTTVISVTADGNLEVTSTYPKYGHGDGVGKQGVLPHGAMPGAMCGLEHPPPSPSNVLVLQG